MPAKGNNENIKKIMLNRLNQTLKKNDTEALKKSLRNKYLWQKKATSNGSNQNQSKVIKPSPNDSIAK